MNSTTQIKLKHYTYMSYFIDAQIYRHTRKHAKKIAVMDFVLAALACLLPRCLLLSPNRRKTRSSSRHRLLSASVQREQQNVASCLFNSNGGTADINHNSPHMQNVQRDQISADRCTKFCGWIYSLKKTKNKTKKQALCSRPGLFFIPNTRVDLRWLCLHYYLNPNLLVISKL